jgi:hypothetical protein
MHRNRQLELVLQLEAQLLEQLELEKRVRPEKHLNSTKHLPQTQRKSAPNLLESDGPKQVLKRARSIQSMTATKCKKKSIKLTVGTSFDHSTLGGKTKFDAVTHSVSVPITPGSTHICSSPKATFGKSSRMGGSQRALLINPTTKEEISTIYKAHDLSQHPTLEGAAPLPGSIGLQVEGRLHRNNSPKVVIPRATKQQSRKLFISKQLAQIDSSDRDSIPAPNHYDHLPNAIGPQPTSRYRSAPSISFSESAPTGRDPVYSGDHRKKSIAPHSFGAKPFNKNGVFEEPNVLAPPPSVVSEEARGQTFGRDPRMTVPIHEPRLLSKGWLEMIRGKDAPPAFYNVHNEPGVIKRTGTGSPMKKRNDEKSKRRAQNRLDIEWMKTSTFGANDGSGRDSYLERDTRRRCQGKQTLAEQIEEGRRALNEKYKLLEESVSLKKQKTPDYSIGVSAFGKQCSARWKLGRSAPQYTFSTIPKRHHSDVQFYTPESEIDNRKERYPHIPTR